MALVLTKKGLSLAIIFLFIVAGVLPSLANATVTKTGLIHIDPSKRGLFPLKNCDFLRSIDMLPKLKISNNNKIEEKYSTVSFNTNNINIESSASKKWTWMFYDDADFYMAYDPLEDFSEEAYSSENLDVLVLQDKEYGPAKMWYIDENHNTKLLENMGEINMGDSQTLQDFIGYSKTNYPADRYLISFYDHGGGWKGVCWDVTSNNDYLTMNEVQTALTNTGGIDIVCHTAPCLMGALESAYELRDCVDVYIGSEEGSGYGHWFGTIENMCNKLNDNPNLSNNEFGEYVIQSIWGMTSWPDSITMSAVSTSKLEPLVTSLDTVASDFITYYSNDSYDLFWEIYDNIQSFGNGFCIDTYDFAEKCRNEDFSQEIVQDLMLVIDRFSEVIIDECHGDYPNAHGLTIYVPDISKYSYESEYGDPDYGLDFSQNTQWDEFISKYCTKQIEPGVDQYQTETTTAMIACKYFIWAQSFKPSKDLLTKVKLKLGRLGNITTDLNVIIRKNKTGKDLTAIAIPYTRISSYSWEWVSFNFPDINVTPGETYYILLYTDGGDNNENFYSWAGSKNPNSYQNGDIWIQWSSGQWAMWDPPIDSCFKTFFVESTLDPPTITGPSSGKPGIQYEYTFVAYDLNNLNISYYIDWGDGTNSDWIGPYPPGEEHIVNHTWDSKGSFIIKAKAKNSDGIETDWSILEVIMPKSIAIFTQLLSTLENHPSLFPIMSQLMGL